MYCPRCGSHNDDTAAQCEMCEYVFPVDLIRAAPPLATAPAGKLSLPVARLSSGNPLEDRELRKRIDARRFPSIDGVLTGMAAGDDGRYRVSGDLTFRGVVRHCEDEMTVEVVDDDTIRLDGESTFDIRDFGMEPPRILMLRVHPEVVVRVEIVAVKEG